MRWHSLASAGKTTAPVLQVRLDAWPLGRLARILCAAPFLLSQPSLAAQPSVSPCYRPTAAEATDPDWLLTVQAREALQKDEMLGPLNVGVSVFRRVGTLWGLVPSATLAQRAEVVLRHVPGLVEVRSELHVVPPDDPLFKILSAPAVPRPAPAALPEFPPGPGSLMGRVWNEGPAPVLGETRPSTPLLMMPAIPLPRPPASSARTPPAELLAPTPLTGSPDLAAAVERLQRHELRFRFVQVEVQGRIVQLRGRPDQAQAVMELASAISQLSGVERVRVEGINTSR